MSTLGFFERKVQTLPFKLSDIVLQWFHLISSFVTSWDKYHYFPLDLDKPHRENVSGSIRTIISDIQFTQALP
jgi:hypothetical protein